MLKLGTQGISALYLGGLEIKQAYLGESLVFGAASPPVCTITATIDPPEAGTVTGAGQYQAGETVTLVATAGDGYEFSGWQEGGQTVSTSASYTFTAAADRALTAAFAAIPAFNPVWTQVTLPVNKNWVDICFANGKFVAVSSDGVPIYSATGKTWTSSGQSALSASFFHIVFGDGRYCAYDASTTRYSADGIFWTTNTSSPNTAKLAAAYGPNGFILIGNLSGVNFTYYSTNGYTHTLRGDYLTKATNPSDMAYGNGKYVVLGGSNSNAGFYCEWGGTWTKVTLPSTASWKRIIYAGGRFVAIATGSNKALCSENGIDWEAAVLPFSGDWNALAYGDGVYVALAKRSEKVAYSTDGKTWKLTENTLPGTGWGNNSLEYGDGRFVVMSYGAAAYTS